MDVIKREGLDPAFYAKLKAREDEVFPWDVIDCGVDKSFFERERKKAYEAVTTKCCKEACSGCGANKLGGERTWCPNSSNQLK